MPAVTVTPAWYFYVLECADGSFYAGITTDIERRLAQHRSGKGARYTRGRAPLRLLHCAPCPDRAAALRAEAAFKALARPHKRAWLAQNASTCSLPTKDADALAAD